ncbi:MAG TPA: hypothetical protein VF421_19925 [Niabella sp.]
MNRETICTAPVSEPDLLPAFLTAAGRPLDQSSMEALIKAIMDKVPASHTDRPLYWYTGIKRASLTPGHKKPVSQPALYTLKKNIPEYGNIAGKDPAARINQHHQVISKYTIK